MKFNQFIPLALVVLAISCNSAYGMKGVITVPAKAHYTGIDYSRISKVTKDEGQHEDAAWISYVGSDKEGRQVAAASRVTKPDRMPQYKLDVEGVHSLFLNQEVNQRAFEELQRLYSR